MYKEKEMKKEEIREIRKNINSLRMKNVLKGFLVGLSGFGLVAGSAFGITGGTLIAVGQTRINDVVNSYMASQEFQDEKIEMQEQMEETTNHLSQLEKFYQQGYLSKAEYYRIKQELANGFNNISDFQLAKRIIDNNDDNQFHAILKKHEHLSDAGKILLAPSALIFIFKGALDLSLGEWGVYGKATLDDIAERAWDIKHNNSEIQSDKARIKDLKREEAKESKEEDEKED